MAEIFSELGFITNTQSVIARLNIAMTVKQTLLSLDKNKDN